MINLVILSDIHFRTFGNNKHIFTKLNAFTKAIKARLSDQKEEIVLIVNGDIADRGSKDEFEEALSFFNNLKKELIASGYNFSFIFSPGNHDTDITKLEQEEVNYRNIKRKEAKKNPNILLDCSFSTDHLVEFQAFIKKFNNEPTNTNIFYDQYIYNSAGHTINIVSYNSAVPFDLDAKQGDIFINSEIVDSNLVNYNDEIVISVSHYPLEWYNRDSKKFYNNLKKSNLLITAHEHSYDIQYIKGNGVDLIELKTPGFADYYRTNESGFIICRIDTQNCSVDINIMSYERGIYKSIDERNNCRIKNSIFIEKAILPIRIDSYNRFMDSDISAFSNKKINSFNEAFVSPYFMVYNQSSDSFDSYSFEDIDNWQKPGNLLIKGTSRVGKTFTLRKLFDNYYKSGYIPIYIESSPQTKLENLIIRSVERTYDTSYDFILQNKNKVILLIDNIERYGNGLTNFIFETEKIGFKKVIWTVNAEYYNSNQENHGEYEVITQLPFGHKQKFDLIEKWVSQDKTLDESKQNEKMLEIKKVLDTVTSNPDFENTPALIIIFLEAYDNNEHNKLIKGSKGVYYDYLVSKYILQVSSLSKIDALIIENYLTELSYYIFLNKKYDQNDFDKCYLTKYPENSRHYYDYTGKINKTMLDMGLFDLNSTYYFTYSFMYSYMCAKYFIININDNMDDIIKLVDSIDDNISANILLFIVHWSKDRRIIDKLLDKTNSLFSYHEPIFKNEDFDIFNQFISGVKNVETYRKVKENNRELCVELDKLEREQKESKSTQNSEHVKSRHTIELESSLKIRDVINEVLSQRLDRDSTEKLIKANIEMGLRKSKDYVYYFFESLVWLSEQSNVEEIGHKYVHDRLVTIIIILFEILTNMSPSYLYDFSIEIAASNNNNIVTTVLSILLKLIQSRGTHSKDSNNYFEFTKENIQELVNYRNDLIEKENYILAAFVNFVVEREMNYEEMEQKTKNLLLQMMTSNTNVGHIKGSKHYLSAKEKNRKKRIDMIISKRNE